MLQEISKSLSRWLSNLAWLTSQNFLRAARRGPVDLAWLGVAYFKIFSVLRPSSRPKHHFDSLCIVSLGFSWLCLAGLGLVWLGCLASLRLPWLGFASLGLVGLLNESAGRVGFATIGLFTNPLPPTPTSTPPLLSAFVGP